MKNGAEKFGNFDFSETEVRFRDSKAVFWGAETPLQNIETPPLRGETACRIAGVLTEGASVD